MDSTIQDIVRSGRLIKVSSLLEGWYQQEIFRAVRSGEKKTAERLVKILKEYRRNENKHLITNENKN